MSDKANIITQAPRTATVPGGKYGDLDYHGEPPWDVALAAGWRKLDPRQAIDLPEGYRIAGYAYAQDPERPDYALETVEVEAIPDAFPAPDVIIPMLDAEGNQIGTARIISNADLQIIAVVDTASPQKSVAEQIAAFVARSAKVQSVSSDVATWAQAAATAAAAANSVPALREQVAILAEQVKRLAELK